ncbi:hypothetical protein JST97_01245 [bacterium]|nr:hypothetical protein [bacterium]
MRLFLTLYRFTTGYLRSWTCIGETLLLEMTGLSSSSLYEAKRVLVALGYIQIRHMVSGRCEYRICEGLQTLRAEAEKGVAARFARKASGGSEADPSGQPEPWKESKEKKYHHPAQAKTLPLNPNLTKANTSREGDDASLDANFKRLGLTEQLKSAGVSEFMAHKLTREHPPEMIALAMERLKQVRPENPAGYLVAEVLRGGYQTLRVEPEKVQREQREKIHQLRVEQRERELQQRDEGALRVAQKLEFFEQLSVEHRNFLKLRVESQALSEGFTRLPGWGVEHPAYRGLLAEVLAAWQLEGKQRE